MPCVPDNTDHHYEQVTRALLRARLASGERVRFTVTGTSMLPLIRPAHAVWVEQVQPARIQRGDLVAFWLRGTLVTHRVVAPAASGWYTKGDNCRTRDPHTDNDAVFGRVVIIERGTTRGEVRTASVRMVSSMLAWLSWQEGMLVEHLQRLRRQPGMASRLLALPVRVSTAVLRRLIGLIGYGLLVWIYLVRNTK